MLIKKENTNYGYCARIRYDVKSPKIHVLEKGGYLKIKGEADITVISGQLSVMRKEGIQKIYDKLNNKDTYRIPLGKEIISKPIISPCVILEDGTTTNKIEQYLDLTVKEDEPSSDDLKYITEWQHQKNYQTT